MPSHTGDRSSTLLGTTKIIQSLTNSGIHNILGCVLFSRSLKPTAKSSAIFFK